MLQKSKTLNFFDKNGDKYPEWEEKELGEVGTTFSGLSGKTKDDFGSGSNEFITYMNVFSNIIANPLMIEKVKISEDEKQNEVVKGDILFTTSSETLKDVGLASLWNEDKSVFLNSFCFGFRIENFDVLSRYLITALRSPLGRKRITFLGQGTTRINISKTKLMNIQIPIPSLPEQEKIAEFFSTLDERIELQSQKINLLREQKRGYLQRVFSRELVFVDDNGDKYPEWVQTSLQDISSVTSGKRLPKGHGFAQEGTPYITVSNMGYKKVNHINLPYLSPKTTHALSRYKVSENDIIISIAGTVGKVNLIDSTLDQVVLTENCNKIRVSQHIVPEFIYYILKSPSIQIEIEKESTTSSQPKLALERLRKLSFNIPTLVEQQKIAEFFSVLDENIELNEQKLELLKDQKKGYLQGVFGT